MKYSGVIYNDITAAPGLCVTFFAQGCPHKCHGCHNPETWDFNGGQDFNQEVLDNIIKGLTSEGIQRNFCIMGGEPLADENLFLTLLLVNEVREKCPNASIYIWTGYIYEELKNNSNNHLQQILSKIDYLIDGPYKEELRDITLEMRGSSNQRIIELYKIDKN